MTSRFLARLQSGPCHNKFNLHWYLQKGQCQFLRGEVKSKELPDSSTQRQIFCTHGHRFRRKSFLIRWEFVSASAKLEPCVAASHETQFPVLYPEFLAPRNFDHPISDSLAQSKMNRKEKIARSVTDAILRNEDEKTRKSAAKRIRRLIKAVFTLYTVRLNQHTPELFSQLRQKFEVDDTSYAESFEPFDEGKTTLRAKGHMGYSGSTFFTTNDGKYLIKSIPRHFENSFFRGDLLKPYVAYLSDNLSSLLIRITDFLAVDDAYKISPGIVFGCAPSHHIVMENLLFGRDEGQHKAKQLFNPTQQPQRSQGSRSDPDVADGEQENTKAWKWETWDLKPITYFFPERDIAQGKLSSEVTKSRLADEFNDKLHLTRAQADDFQSHLNRDTALLESVNAVDYSLFLVRIPVPPKQEARVGKITPENPFVDSYNLERSTTEVPDLAATAPTLSTPPFIPPNPPSWRTGVLSADGRYVYRAAILDFFWAKHKAHAKMMTHLVNVWNMIDLGGSKGPMSITTSSSDYRERFRTMCEGFIEISGV